MLCVSSAAKRAAEPEEQEDTKPTKQAAAAPAKGRGKKAAPAAPASPAASPSVKRGLGGHAAPATSAALGAVSAARQWHPNPRGCCSMLCMLTFQLTDTDSSRSSAHSMHVTHEWQLQSLITMAAILYLHRWTLPAASAAVTF